MRIGALRQVLRMEATLTERLSLSMRGFPTLIALYPVDMAAVFDLSMFVAAPEAIA